MLPSIRKSSKTMLFQRSHNTEASDSTRSCSTITIFKTMKTTRRQFLIRNCLELLHLMREQQFKTGSLVSAVVTKLESIRTTAQASLTEVVGKQPNSTTDALLTFNNFYDPPESDKTTSSPTNKNNKERRNI